MPDADDEVLEREVRPDLRLEAFRFLRGGGGFLDDRRARAKFRLARLLEQRRVNDEFHRRRASQPRGQAAAQDVEEVRLEPFLHEEVRHAEDRRVAFEANGTDVPEPEREALLADVFLDCFEDGRPDV